MLLYAVFACVCHSTGAANHQCTQSGQWNRFTMLTFQCICCFSAELFFLYSKLVNLTRLSPNFQDNSRFFPFFPVVKTKYSAIEGFNLSMFVQWEKFGTTETRLVRDSNTSNQWGKMELKGCPGRNRRVCGIIFLRSY